MIDLKKEIMEQNRHLVIYGYNNIEREKFLKEMVSNYKVKVNSDKPVGIYLDNLGLPSITNSNFELDKIAITAFKRDYFSNLVNIEILKSILEQEKELEIKSDEFLKFAKYFTKPDIKINDLSELKKNLEISNDIYYEKYLNYLKDGSLHNFYEELPVTFFNLEMAVKKYKEMLNLNSYFALVLDYKTKIDSINERVINTFIGSRINGDLSIKLVCEPNSFNVAYDLNDNFVQSCHDYGVVELDDSLEDYQKKLIKN